MTAHAASRGECTHSDSRIRRKGDTYDAKKESFGQSISYRGGTHAFTSHPASGRRLPQEADQPDCPLRSGRIYRCAGQSPGKRVGQVFYRPGYGRESTSRGGHSGPGQCGERQAGWLHASLRVWLRGGLGHSSYYENSLQSIQGPGPCLPDFDCFPGSFGSFRPPGQDFKRICGVDQSSLRNPSPFNTVPTCASMA